MDSQIFSTQGILRQNTKTVLTEQILLTHVGSIRCKLAIQKIYDAVALVMLQ